MIVKLFSQLMNLTFCNTQKIKFQLLLSLLALGFTTAWCYQRADAVAYNWTNTGGGDWTTDGNWSATGDPDDSTDTASLGDLSGSYTTTLSSNRTIGGLTLSGSDPTLTVDSTLTILGGTSTISGGTLNGTGTINLDDNAGTAPTINWTGSPMGGSLTLEVQYQKDNSPTINNSVGAFGIASGQTLQWINRDGGAGAGEDLTFVNGFDNAGSIILGQPQPGQWYANMRMHINNGTLTNTSTGAITMNAREPNNLAAPWNNRFILGNIDNQGLVTVLTPSGQLGTTGKSVTNSGTITLDSSVIAGGSSDGRATLNIIADTFTNAGSGIINVDDGTLNVTATSFPNSGTINLTTGTLNVTGTSFPNTGTINVNAGTLSVITDTFTMTGVSVDGGTVAFGGLSNDTDITWAGDIVNDYTFRVNKNAEITVNRVAQWDILNGQTLEFEIGGGNSETSLTTNQDVTNSGVILMGKEAPGDNFINHRMVINSTNSRLTNNADGEITMFTRSDSNFGDPWSVRRLEAELVNNGTFNVQTHRGFLGKTGVDHINNGTLTLDDVIHSTTPQTVTLNVTGDSLTNASGGTIEGNGILNVTGVTFNNAGTLSPGLSAGILTVQGDIEFQSGSTIYIEVTGENGVAGVDYDQLIVTGNANGLTQADLVVDVSSGELVLLDDVLTIMSSGNDLSSVEFNSITFVGGNYIYDIEYGNGFIQLSNIESFIPEPSSGLMLLMGLIALRRRNRRNA